MKMVKIYRVKERMVGHDVVLELFINENSDEVEGGALTPFGDTLLEKLKEDFKNYKSKVYLENLHKELNSPYLFASKYIEQKSSLPE